MFKILKKLFKIFLLAVLMIAVLFIGFSYHDYRELKEAYPVEDIKETLMSHTNEYVEYDEISEDLIYATVAIEDRRYFERYGVDYISLARAIVTNLIKMDFVQGGSTIEQQFIKIYYFKYQRSLTKKLIEIFFIYDLDDYYSKEEIIEMYLNIINYGDGYIGIGAASKGYFDKLPSELSLYESALMAGIPNSPANLQLSNNNPKTYERQRKILKNMLELGHINIQEYEEASKIQQ